MPTSPRARARVRAALTSAPPRSALESLLVAKQVTTYCRQINRFAGQSMSKLLVASALQK